VGDHGFLPGRDRGSKSVTAEDRFDLSRDRDLRRTVSLVHTPWLDAFRLTLAGALLLGRIFSPWDMLAYGVGIVLGMLLDRVGTSSAHEAPHSAS
jgi:hypothetical protein